MASVCSRKRYRVFLPFEVLNLHVLKIWCDWWFSSIINKKKETENSNETKFCEVSYATLYLFD